MSSGSDAAFDPMHQFEVAPLVPLKLADYDISFTNSALFMVLAIVVTSLFMIASTRRKAMVPGRWQGAAEIMYEFVASTLKDIVGSQGRPFFPFVFSVFMFILLANLLGMMPYSFTVTSHITVTFALAMLVFLGVTLVGFVKHGLKFFGLFYPSGVHWSVGILMVPIELFSYLSRPISLSIRLAANMMAGHLLLKVVASFIAMMGVAGVLPFAFMVLFSGFEFFVAVLQAYIFTVLTCVYLNDALHLH